MKPSDTESHHPDRILFPGEGITRADLARYYARVAEHMLPHIRSRPLTLKQYPRGIGEDGFFHKHAPDYFPAFIGRLEVPMRSEAGKSMLMVSADEAADLEYFAGQSAIEVHMGLSCAGGLETPDQVIFDLDPSDDDFGKVRDVAFALRDILTALQLPSFLKTTGSRGVHIHVPLQTRDTFDTVKDKTRSIALRLHQTLPELTTMEHLKRKRGDRVFLDYLRNDYGMTAVAPYSLRARDNAPVATPIDWEELKQRRLGPQRYTLGNIFRRLSHKTDPWREFDRQRTTLPDIC